MAAVMLAMILSVLMPGKALAAEGYRSYTVDEVQMKFNVPDDLYVLARNMEEDDPALAYFGVSAAEVEEALGDLSLAILPEDGTWEIDVTVCPLGEGTMFTDEMEDLSEYNAIDLTLMKGQINEQDPENPVEITEVDGYPFFFGTINGLGFYTQAYVSVINGYEVWLVLSGPDEEPGENMLTEWEDILSNIVIGEADEAPEEEISEPAEEKEQPEAEEPAEPMEEEKPAEEPVPDVSGTTLYELDDIGLNMELANAYHVFTRDMDEDDPTLALFGLDAESVNALLDASGAYIDVFPDDVAWELGVTVESNKAIEQIGEMALYSLEDIEDFLSGQEEEICKPIAEQLGEDISAVQVKREEAVRIGNYNYFRMDITAESENAVNPYMSMYITAYGGTEYVFAFASQSSTMDLTQIAEEILSEVEFTHEATGITEPPSGFSIDWTKVAVFALVGVVAGAVCVIFSLRSKKRTEKRTAGTAPDDRSADFSTNGPQGRYSYSIPGSKQGSDNDTE